MDFEEALAIVLDLAYGGMLDEKDADTDELMGELHMQQMAMGRVELYLAQYCGRI